jgi:hypothetical protein
VRAGEPGVAPGRTVEVDGFGGPVSGDGGEEEGADAARFEGARGFCGKVSRRERKREECASAMDWLVVRVSLDEGKPILLSWGEREE